jgi:hypothetical protein
VTLSTYRRWCDFVGANKNASFSPAEILALLTVDFCRGPTTRRQKSTVVITRNGNSFSMLVFCRGPVEPTAKIDPTFVASFLAISAAFSFAPP